MVLDRYVVLTERTPGTHPVLNGWDVEPCDLAMLAADAGAGLRELMDRMGHSTTRAALTYLHGSDERQRAIAEALSILTAAEAARGGLSVVMGG